MKSKAIIIILCLLLLGSCKPFKKIPKNLPKIAR